MSSVHPQFSAVLWEVYTPGIPVGTERLANDVSKTAQNSYRRHSIGYLDGNSMKQLLQHLLQAKAVAATPGSMHMNFDAAFDHSLKHHITNALPLLEKVHRQIRHDSIS